MGLQTSGMLHLPVRPVEWHRGAIELVAVTTQGGTVCGIYEACPGSRLDKFGALTEGTRTYKAISDIGGDLLEEADDNPLVRMAIERNTDMLSDAIEDLYAGRKVILNPATVGGQSGEYYAMPSERINEVPGELVDAALFLDPARLESYQVTPRVAAQAFDALARVGFDIAQGKDPLKCLIPFFSYYGFPRDGNRGAVPRSESGAPLPPGIVFSSAKYQALLAHVCSALWSHIQRKDYSEIGSMAHVDEQSLLLSFIQPHHVSLIQNGSSVSTPHHHIKIDAIPQNFDSVWKAYAKNWLYSVAENQISALFGTRVPSGSNSYSIGVRPGGLQTAMWLTFTETIYQADNPHEGMRQCKQGGKFHGCGEWYMPNGPFDRSHYCPACRTKAGAERTARLRAKQKGLR